MKHKSEMIDELMKDIKKWAERCLLKIKEIWHYYYVYLCFRGKERN